MTPSSADAVPATAACSASASAVELGSTNARLETMTNIGASTAHTDSPPTETTTSSASALATTNPSARRSSRVGPTRSTSRALTWLAAIRPSPFIANARLKSCGESP